MEIHHPEGYVVNVQDRLHEVALQKGLRQSTMLSYQRLLGGLGLLHREVETLTREDVLDALWTLDNPNTRRAAAIAARSVLGLDIKVPRGIPRRYKLPDEDSLRLALMTSPHEARGLQMMYAGLRIGEACAITAKDLDGDRLRVDKQIQMLHRTGKPTVVKTVPVKSREADVVVPAMIQQVVPALQDTAKPDVVRESLRRAGRKVGITLNPHMLRHWYATTLLARGASLVLVARQMRHSDVSVTLRTYAQYEEGSIHDLFGS